MNLKFSLEEVLGYLDITAVNNLPENTPIEGVSTDTRTIQPGNIFVALKGNKFDGHDFVEIAIERGAPICLVNQEWFQDHNNDKLPLIVVPNTLYALGELANLYRCKFDIPVIAVAGSNGKTTTKDFIAHILSQKYKVLKTESNLNNQIGLPLTLFRLSAEHQIAVIEIGTNQFGEINRLCEIAQPNFGLITNIGKEHLEAFVDLDGVEMEETSLFAYLMKHNGIAIINNDDERLKKYGKIIENKFTFGSGSENNLNYSISFDEELFASVEFESNGVKFQAKLNTKGYGVAMACIPAVAVGLLFELSEKDIIEGIQSFKLPEYGLYGRMQILNLGNLTILNDTYNANPSSMQLALETIKKLGAHRTKIAILGDMLELGDASLNEHCELLQKAEEICDKIFIFGNEMKKAYQTLRLAKAKYFEDKNEIPTALKQAIVGNEILLFKASRAMRCENILTVFINNF
ncbi:MAG: UDP-N-acetylmuramoyl-tripeptide--D-alanyl-D-alanine ligase [Candidatus Kapaibacteriota bacterium]